eukprot:15446802-Alexandrium_andersonii.AAC.1
MRTCRFAGLPSGRLLHATNNVETRDCDVLMQPPSTPQQPPSTPQTPTDATCKRPLLAPIHAIGG